MIYLNLTVFNTQPHFNLNTLKVNKIKIQFLVNNPFKVLTTYMVSGYHIEA